MGKLILSPMSVGLFCHDKTLRKLVGEASDLPQPWLRPVWDDSADRGVMVRGKVETKLFVLTDTEVRDGEVVVWHFKEFGGDWTLAVLND